MRANEAQAVVDGWGFPPNNLTEASGVGGVGGRIKTAAGRGVLAGVLDPQNAGVALGTWCEGGGADDYCLVARLWRDDAASRAVVHALKAQYPITDICYVGRLAGPRQVPVTWAASRLQSRQEVPFPGLSIGHYAVTAGTLGAFVKRPGDSSLYILSNNHVLANTNTVRTPNRSAIGDPVLQPGTYDGGTLEGDQIGELADFHQMQLFRETLDAAIALIHDPSRYRDRYDGARIAGATTALAYQGQRVWKLGRTTGKTWGTVGSTRERPGLCGN